MCGLPCPGRYDIATNVQSPELSLINISLTWRAAPDLTFVPPGYADVALATAAARLLGLLLATDDVQVD